MKAFLPVYLRRHAGEGFHVPGSIVSMDEPLFIDRGNSHDEEDKEALRTEPRTELILRWEFVVGKNGTIPAKADVSLESYRDVELEGSLTPPAPYGCPECEVKDRRIAELESELAMYRNSVPSHFKET